MYTDLLQQTVNFISQLSTIKIGFDKSYFEYSAFENTLRQVLVLRIQHLHGFQTGSLKQVMLFI